MNDTRPLQTGKPYLLDVDDIEVPDEWNARSGDWESDPASPDSADGGFEGLCASIRTHGGNHTPVTLRRHSNPKHDPPFLLVTGFRRMRALKKEGIREVLAIVEEMTETEARLRNIGENVREGLKPADMAWQIARISESDPSWTPDMIAERVGVSQAYTKNLFTIMRKVRPELTKEWRRSQVEVSVSEMMTLAKLPEHEQEARFRKSLMGEKMPLARGSRRQTRSLFTQLVDRAGEFGQNLKVLNKFLSAFEMNADWKEVALAMFPKAASLSPKELEKVAQCLRDGLT